MKSVFYSGLVACATIAVSQAGSLYYIPNQTEDSLPIEWTLGTDVIYDDNTTPTAVGPDDESFAINPYLQTSITRNTPQTVWDVMAKIGVIYYLDEIQAAGADDTYGQFRLNANLQHNFSERLSFASRNFASYELEPDYAYGFATNRQSSEFLYMSTDNSISYSWTDRFATITGFSISSLDYDNVPNADRFTITGYNQFRYALSPQTILTSSYRYSQTEGSEDARDSTDQFFLVGFEQGISENTILTTSFGAQLRDVDGVNGESTTSPYLEANLRTLVNEQLTVTAFARYGMEANDTLQTGAPLAGPTEFDSRLTLRVGSRAEYQVSEFLNVYGGVDVIKTSYEEGRLVTGGAAVADQDETLMNAYVGASVRFTDYLTGSLTYNFTDADSDFDARSYDRNRITVGVEATF